MSTKVKELQKLAQNMVLLYVEDNSALQGKATILFKKFFGNVLIAHDGQEGLDLFKKYKNKIDFIITDINMPKLSGMEMSKLIREMSKDVVILVTTGYDDKEYLIDSISVGVAAYLIKPLSLDTLTTQLFTLVKERYEQKSKAIFDNYLEDIFNNQTNLVFMLNKVDIVISNHKFLDFFGVESVKYFKEKFSDFGATLEKHDSFLFNSDEVEWLSELLKNSNKMFHVKIYDTNHSAHHFIITCSYIPNKKDYFIVNLNDITELNLLDIFDKKSSNHDKALKDSKNISNLLQNVMKNSIKIKAHNYYKGLSITNSALIYSVNSDIFSIKVTALQQKAIHVEQKTILSSEIFPFDIELSEIVKNSKDDNIVSAKKALFLESSPTQRSVTTLAPDENSKVTMFFDERKFDTDTTMTDISIKSVSVLFGAIPAGFKEDQDVLIDIVLTIDRVPVIINTPAKVYKVIELKHTFKIVFLFALNDKQHHQIVDYISNRQMGLIREFKKL